MAVDFGAARRGDAVDSAQLVEQRRAGRHVDVESRVRRDRRLELGRRARRDDAPAVDDGDAVAELVRLGHVVRGEDHGARGILGHPASHLAAHVARGADVERDCRLVEEQHARVGDEAADQVHLLAHAARELGDAAVARLVQAEPLQQLVDALAHRAAAHAVELREHPELLAHGEDAVAGVLPSGDHRDPRSQRAEVAGDVEPVDACGARAGREQRHQDLDQRRLAGTVGPEQAVELAAPHLEVDAVERRDLAAAGAVDAADAVSLHGETGGRAGGGGRNGRGDRGHPDIVDVVGARPAGPRAPGWGGTPDGLEP